ncbi:MAG: signal recognition particle-docking protein FtsY [Thermoplasmatota archaeon]
MFDGLKKKLKEFSGKVSEEAEVVPAAPPPKKTAAPAKAAPRSEKPAATFEVVKREAPRTAATAPAVARPAAKETAEQKRAAAEFDREITNATEAAPGASPETFAEGVEASDIETARMPRVDDFASPAARRDMNAAQPHPPSTRPQERATPVVVAPSGDGRAINVEKIDDLLWDLELSLLESDVALPVVEEIKEALKTNLKKLRVRNAAEVPTAVEAALRAAILEALTLDEIDFDTWLLDHLEKKKPVVLMFVGVNGTGKTTAIGRIAHRLKENGFSSVMAAGDTFRAGAIEQLSKHGEKLGITVIKHNAGGDPAAVAYDAIEHAKSRMKDVVLLDTAGRMQTNTNLMDEMKKIKRVANPDMIIFVGDSLAGNDAVEQAIHFDKAVGIDASILTKVDTDAKGGAALSIAHAVGKPILFVGVGQEYGDLVPYDPKWMVARIFD